MVAALFWNSILVGLKAQFLPQDVLVCPHVRSATAAPLSQKSILLMDAPQMLAQCWKKLCADVIQMPL